MKPAVTKKMGVLDLDSLVRGQRLYFKTESQEAYVTILAFLGHTEARVKIEFIVKNEGGLEDFKEGEILMVKRNTLEKIVPPIQQEE